MAISHQGSTPGSHAGTIVNFITSVLCALVDIICETHAALGNRPPGNGHD